MIRSAIRHLASNQDGKLFAAAEYEHTVHIFSFDSPNPISTFASCLDFGGRRLVLSDDDTMCVTSNYYAPGTAAYLIPSGKVAWTRKDLRKTGTLRVAPGNLLVCEREKKALQIVNLADGDLVEEIRGGRDLIQSNFEPIRVLQKRTIELQTSEGIGIARIPRETFAVLDLVFVPGLLILSESGGTVRALSTKDGELKWRFSPPAGSHVLKLSFNEVSEIIVAVCWSYQFGGEKTLLSLDLSSGELVQRFSLGQSATEEFCKRGTRLLSSEGKLIDSRTGELVFTYNVPQGSFQISE